jgi:hypothetical protein
MGLGWFDRQQGKSLWDYNFSSYGATVFLYYILDKK